MEGLHKLSEWRSGMPKRITGLTAEELEDLCDALGEWMGAEASRKDTTQYKRVSALMGKAIVELEKRKEEKE